MFASTMYNLMIYHPKIRPKPKTVKYKSKLQVRRVSAQKRNWLNRPNPNGTWEHFLFINREIDICQVSYISLIILPEKWTAGEKLSFSTDFLHGDKMGMKVSTWNYSLGVRIFVLVINTFQFARCYCIFRLWFHVNFLVNQFKMFQNVVKYSKKVFFTTFLQNLVKKFHLQKWMLGNLKISILYSTTTKMMYSYYL